MITEYGVKRALGVFSLLKFFPKDEDFRAGFMECIGDMCETDAQVLWLAKRTVQLHSDWPGIQEVRAVLCSAHIPRDGVECYSTVYIDGIPKEREPGPLMIEGKPVLALPAGAVASADPEMEKLAAEVAEARKMPPMPKYRARTEDEIRVDAELRQMFKLGNGEPEK